MSFNANFSRLTKVEFCLTEWKTGTFAHQNLHESSLKERFSSHLKDMIKWDGLAPEVTKNICQKIFDDLRCVKMMHHVYTLVSNTYPTVPSRAQLM